MKLAVSLALLITGATSAFQPKLGAHKMKLVAEPFAFISRARLVVNSRFSQEELDNHANQMNPNNDAYWSSRDDDDDYEYSQADLDNHADQLNPNNDAYWDSRGDDYDDDEYEYSQAELDNHADQMNPNNDAYWSSRSG